MLQTLLAYVRGAGIDARWLVIEGDPSFFAITKRIHNGLYGLSGDGGELGAAARRHSERVIRGNADEMRALVRPGDVAQSLAGASRSTNLCSLRWARHPVGGGASSVRPGDQTQAPPPASQTHRYRLRKDPPRTTRPGPDQTRM